MMVSSSNAGAAASVIFTGLKQAVRTRPMMFKQSQISTTPSCELNQSKQVLKPGLYLVGTPIGNLEDITLRALRVLGSANVILSEDTRHSAKLLHHYNIKTPLLSYHKFNESHREQTVLNRLQSGDIVALITDAGTPGISDPGMELAKLCVGKGISVIPIPGPCALVAALSASGLPTNEFTFVGFLPKHASSRNNRLVVSANEAATQIFFVPPHKLCQFLQDTSSIFGESRYFFLSFLSLLGKPLALIYIGLSSFETELYNIHVLSSCRRCVIAREITKMHEEFWHGTIGEAREVYSTQQPKGEITLLIEGKTITMEELPSVSQLESELADLVSGGHSLSMAVKLVAAETSMKRKEIYSIALRKFGKKLGSVDDD
ncbi:RNA processing factor [Lithospermum erythrorhizon]|uniref:RNA processing factor n=1 Tax=Lithospermum erythrorhizon TaxID=34254 RepID=A0AAV3QPD6_LITER